MKLHYFWRAASLETRPEMNHQGAWFEESVRVVHWQRVLKVPDAREVLYVGKASFSSIDTDRENFILYGDLYEDQVIEWVIKDFKEDFVESIDKKLLVEYNNVPKEEKKVPW